MGGKGQDLKVQPFLPVILISSKIVINLRKSQHKALYISLLALSLVLVACSHTSSTSSGKLNRRFATTAALQIPAIEAGVLPWTLQAPISREVVLSGSGSTLEIVGGLEANGSSSAGVFSLDTSNGSLTYQSQLPSGVHDAGGLQIAGSDFVLGGGSPATVSSVEEISGVSLPSSTAQSSTYAPSSSPTSASTSQSPTAPINISPLAVSSIGNLPQPRSDSVAINVDGTGYIVGGYDGTNPDPEVLSTTNGKVFDNVGELKIPVRYAAVASVGSNIYIFGGEQIGGANSGVPTNVIQMINTQKKSIKVIGTLPLPLEGASAFNLGGNIYIAGGVSTQSPATPAQVSSGCSICLPVTSGSQTTETAIWAFNASTKIVTNAGTLPEPLAYAGSAIVNGRAWMIGGEVSGTPVSTVEMLVPNLGFGVAGQPGAGSPYYGDKLLIADRGNNRLLVLDDSGQITWTYPSASAPVPNGSFYFPDDAFFINHGTAIISNQEQNETIVEIGYPSGKIIWSYGHPGQSGSAPGYLYEPDDAYLLKNGQITVADAYNCRILFINSNGTVAGQIGTTGVCKHNPPTDVGTPNGDTPLQNGNLLVSEINGSWVSEYTPQGSLVFTVHVPISYPSDPQQIGPNSFLISDYTKPGAILEFNSQGQVTYRYQPRSGPGEMNYPSLTELLPSGVFMSNDDYNDRIIAVDPTTQALVWQYGTTGTAGTATGLLKTPDGFDILAPNGTTPTHPYTG